MDSNTIAKGLIALFLIGIIYLALTPTVSNIAEDPSMWDGVTDTDSLSLRNNTMTIYYFSGVLFLVVVIIWMFSASTSKGAVSTYG